MEEQKRKIDRKKGLKRLTLQILFTGFFIFILGAFRWDLVGLFENQFGASILGQIVYWIRESLSFQVGIIAIFNVLFLRKLRQETTNQTIVRLTELLGGAFIAIASLHFAMILIASFTVYGSEWELISFAFSRLVAMRNLFATPMVYSWFIFSVMYMIVYARNTAMMKLKNAETRLADTQENMTWRDWLRWRTIMNALSLDGVEEIQSPLEEADEETGEDYNRN